MRANGSMAQHEFSVSSMLVPDSIEQVACVAVRAGGDHLEAKYCVSTVQSTPYISRCCPEPLDDYIRAAVRAGVKFDEAADKTIGIVSCGIRASDANSIGRSRCNGFATTIPSLPLCGFRCHNQIVKSEENK